MVISLGPGKFYGNSLPRPRFYTDVKFNDHRVDPPISISDPFMSWAEEAHWSMGGSSYKRLRLQGKIEGNANKLRSQLEHISEAQAQSPVQPARSDLVSEFDSPSPPDAPVAVKRRSYMSLIENEKEEDEVEFEGEEFKVVTRSVRRKRLVKKLGDEFDSVASENEGNDSKLDLSKNLSDGSDSDMVGLRTRKRRLMKGGEAVRKVVEEKSANSDSGNGVRSSPRLAKRLKN
ncbi:hypothetical protein TanjilG_05491 [Lupinus angustifolius]|uniref:Uncharacterized protein n=1 Tax=Lupinus angustifolius TaxID=3871 RepID=A0A394DF52_LUPAN|nr:PREDICTED: uncharacterized protein LOC109340104 [Lupinus angustifolius]OIW21513.1 hypothetical protein TanjilG_05491 [Lupinus angustifolius]